MATFPTRWLRLVVGGSAVALVASMAACGGDGDDTAVPPSTTTAESTRIASYCEKAFALERSREPEVDESLPDDERLERAREAAREALPLAQDAVDAAPAEIQADANTLLEARKQLGRTGDSEVDDDPAVTAARDRVHAFDVRNCHWGQTDVRAVEYVFQGLPDTLRRRPTSFDVVNGGSETHELVLLKVRADVQEPAAQILTDDPERAREKLTPAGRAVAAPGETAYKVVDLQAGRYVVACFFTVGGPDGPSHVDRGMFGEFTVP